jgi:hypothetical protein
MKLCLVGQVLKDNRVFSQHVTQHDSFFQPTVSAEAATLRANRQMRPQVKPLFVCHKEWHFTEIHLGRAIALAYEGADVDERANCDGVRDGCGHNEEGLAQA